MADCAHHWAVESPNGSPMVRRTCALCQATDEVSAAGVELSHEEMVALATQEKRRRKLTMTQATDGETKPWREMTPDEHKAFIAKHADELRRALGDGPEHLTNAQIEATYTIPHGSLGKLRRVLGVPPGKKGQRPGKAVPQREESPLVKPTVEMMAYVAPQPSTLDAELAAMRRIAETLEPLAAPERERVIMWAEAKYGGH